MENIYKRMSLTPRNITGGSKLLFPNMRTRDNVDYLDASDASLREVERGCANEWYDAQRSASWDMSRNQCLEYVTLHERDGKWFGG